MISIEWVFLPLCPKKILKKTIDFSLFKKKKKKKWILFEQNKILIEKALIKIKQTPTLNFQNLVQKYMGGRYISYQ